MPLKRSIKKDEFEKLPKDVQEYYTETGDSFTLDVEGFPDTTKLERSLAREREQNSERGAKITALETELTEIKANRTDKEADLDKLTRAHSKAVEKLNADHAAALGKRDTFIVKQMKDTFALDMAKEISTAPSLLARAISERLSVDFEGDEPKLTILDAKGQPSEMKPEQLKKEFLTNPEFKNILVATRASGGRANTQPEKGQGRAAPAQTTEKQPDLMSMSTAQLKEHMAGKVQNDGAE